jgi:hypothetical protein
VITHAECTHNVRAAFVSISCCNLQYDITSKTWSSVNLGTIGMKLFKAAKVSLDLGVILI